MSFKSYFIFIRVVTISFRQAVPFVLSETPTPSPFFPLSLSPTLLSSFNLVTPSLLFLFQFGNLHYNKTTHVIKLRNIHTIRNQFSNITINGKIPCVHGVESCELARIGGFGQEVCCPLQGLLGPHCFCWFSWSHSWCQGSLFWYYFYYFLSLINIFNILFYYCIVFNWFVRWGNFPSWGNGEVTLELLLA